MTGPAPTTEVRVPALTELLEIRDEAQAFFTEGDWRTQHDCLYGYEPRVRYYVEGVIAERQRNARLLAAAEARAVSAEGERDQLKDEQARLLGLLYSNPGGYVADYHAAIEARDEASEQFAKLADAADFTLDALRRASRVVDSETLEVLGECEERLAKARGK